MLNDVPEIEYEELTIPGVELFGPADDYRKYIEAVRDDLAGQKLDYYDSSQLETVTSNLMDAFDLLGEEDSEPIEKFRQTYREECDQEYEKLQKEMHEYTLEDFVKNPFKNISFKSIWKETQYDLSFDHLFSGKGKLLKNNLALFASFGVFSLPHELIHAGVNKLTGGINKEIVVNTLYGGPLWEIIFPEVHSKLMIPFLGGYVQTENPSTAGTIAMAVAPYILTPLGIYLVKKGKEKESIVLAAAGSGLIAAHLGGVIGDWRLAGQNLIKEGVEVVQDTIGVKTSPEYEIEALLAIALGGLYVGSKLLAISYRASKATVNSIRNYANKE